MITDPEAYARIWTALIAVSPVMLIGLALLVAAIIWPKGWR
jgi:hypothetical protein